METSKYTCRHCGKEIHGFNCGCNERSKQKALWDKAQRKSETQEAKVISV